MVKTPRTRHSRTEKEPVTIDLAPDEVSRVGTDRSPATSPAKEAEAPVGKTAEPKAPEARPAEPKPVDPKSTERETAASRPKEAKAEPKSTETKAAETTSFGRQDRGAPADAAKAAPPRQPSAPSRGGGLVAGLIGGVAALALAVGLQFAGVLPERAPATGPEVIDHGPAIAALETQLGELRREIAGLGDAGADDPALAARLAETEEKVTTLASGLESLRGEVASLATRAPGEAASVDLAPFEERIAAMEAAIAALPDASSAEAAIASLRGDVEAGRAQATSRLDALEAAVQTLTGRVDEQAQAPATALIIAASSLKAAIDRGTPFTAELDTYAALAPDAPQLAELRALAAAGVPTRAQITAGSDAAANAMIAAARPVDPQAGIADRLWSSMMGLVQVRPIGMVEGDGVPEVVARLDAAVQAGDYERALVEYEALPPEAKAAGEAFIARLRARHTADLLADQALAAALKA